MLFISESFPLNAYAKCKLLLLISKAKPLLLICGMVFFGLFDCRGQTRKIPQELFPLLKKSNADTQRVHLLLQLAEYYVETEWNYSNKGKVDSALPYLREALRIVDSLQTPVYRCEILRGLGNYYFRCDNTDSASWYYSRLLQIQKNAADKKSEAINWQLFASRTPFLENFLDSIIYRYQQALALFKELKNGEKQSEILGQIGEMYVAQGKLPEAERVLQEALQLQKSFSIRNKYLTYWPLSGLQRKKGNYAKAIEYGLQAIEGVKLTNAYVVQATYMDGVGRMYAEIGKPDSAISLFYKGLEILAKETNHHWNVSNTRYDIINQMVPAFLQTGRKNDALILLKRTAKSYPPDNDYTRLLYAVSMGNCMKGLGMLNEAEQSYLQALAIAERTRQVVERANILLLVAELNIRLKRFGKAEEYIARVLKHPKGLATTINLAEISYLQFKIDSATGNYVAAIRHYQNFKFLNDSIFTVEKARQLDELLIQYQTVKREQEIQALQNKAKEQESEYEREKFMKRITLAGVALLSLILLLSHRAYRIKQRSNKRLKLSQQQISQTNLSLQHIIQEKEWLVKEIHHRVKNNLHTIISLLDSQTAYLQDSREKNVIKDSQRRIQAMSLLHQKLYLSSDMSSINMEFYIQELVAYLKESFNAEERIHFNSDIDHIIFDISPAVTIALILNEAITNALKYAFPGECSGVITVMLKEASPGCYKLSISDNGVGLPPDFDIDSHASLGLNLLQGLAADIDGSFSIVSNGGTSISIVFPYKPEGSTLKQQLVNIKENENESIHS
jgi:two-component system, sensor histidine kinase PdtaS